MPTLAWKRVAGGLQSVDFIGVTCGSESSCCCSACKRGCTQPGVQIERQAIPSSPARSTTSPQQQMNSASVATLPQSLTPQCHPCLWVVQTISCYPSAYQSCRNLPYNRVVSASVRHPQRLLTDATIWPFTDQDVEACELQVDQVVGGSCAGPHHVKHSLEPRFE